MFSREELHQAAAEVIGYLKTIRKFSDARVSIIGGLALWMYDNDTTTQSIEFIISIDSALASMKQKLLELPNSPFTQRAQRFFYAASGGGIIQVDITPGRQSPYIPAHAQALKSIPPGTVPYISPIDLIVFKINSCGLQPKIHKRGVDAMDAQRLLIRESRDSPISLTTEQQAFVRKGLPNVLAFTSMPEKWWREKLGLPTD